MDAGYHQTTWEDYLKIDAVNFTSLNYFYQSPALCKLRMDVKEEPTRQMIMGAAVHMAVLEPGLFETKFAPVFHDGRTKDGKKERAEIAAEGRAPMPAEDYRSAISMAQSLFTHPRVSRLLSDAIACEQTAVWHMQGARCKARRDLVGPRWVADVKTCASIDRFSPWTVTDRGYYRQAAWYMDADVVISKTVPEHFFFLVVSNSPPFESAVFRLTDDAIRLGQQENTVLLNGYVECAKTGNWPRHIVELLSADVAPRRVQ